RRRDGRRIDAARRKVAGRPEHEQHARGNGSGRHGVASERRPARLDVFGPREVGRASGVERKEDGETLHELLHATDKNQARPGRGWPMKSTKVATPTPPLASSCGVFTARTLVRFVTEARTTRPGRTPR